MPAGDSEPLAGAPRVAQPAIVRAPDGRPGRGLDRPRRLRERRRALVRDGRDRLLVALIHGLRGLFRRLGIERSLRLGDQLSRLLPLVLREARRLSLEHLATALPELGAARHEQVVRDMLRGTVRTAIETLLLPEIMARLSSFVTIEGLDLFDAGLAGGRGLIPVTGHLGNWELLAATFGALGYPVSVVATPVKGERLDAESIAVRASVRVETIVRSRPTASREILRALRGGRVLAIVMDQDTRGQGVFVPFFGRDARTPVGPAALSLRTGAPLIGAFIHRQPDGTHHIVLRTPELPAPPAARPQARQRWLIEATAALTRMIEVEIRLRPDEWVWWHRRWRRQREAGNPPKLYS